MKFSIVSSSLQQIRDISPPPKSGRAYPLSLFFTFASQQSSGLLKSQHNVHVLHRRAGGPFPQ
uniref:hypothetical protein n=1 Tax=Dysosmobacter welbionis TaxID=2093857 RepID=UPI00307F1F4C